MRGNGGHNLFEDDSYRKAFFDMVAESKKKTGIVILAWCLMGNHVHLIVRAALKQLSCGMARIATAYAKYFNKRTKHFGHVFQGRFASEPIETESHLLEAVRYVHLNPQRAGICMAANYPWSSYNEYVTGKTGLSDQTDVMDMLGSVTEFVNYHNEPGTPHMLCGGRRLNDDLALRLSENIIGKKLSGVIESGKRLRKCGLWALKAVSVSVRQAVRLTGLGRNIVQRAYNSAPFAKGIALIGSYEQFKEFLRKQLEDAEIPLGYE